MSLQSRWSGTHCNVTRAASPRCVFGVFEHPGERGDAHPRRRSSPCGKTANVVGECPVGAFGGDPLAAATDGLYCDAQLLGVWGRTAANVPKYRVHQ